MRWVVGPSENATPTNRFWDSMGSSLDLDNIEVPNSQNETLKSSHGQCQTMRLTIHQISKSIGRPLGVRSLKVYIWVHSISGWIGQGPSQRWWHPECLFCLLWEPSTIYGQNMPTLKELVTEIHGNSVSPVISISGPIITSGKKSVANASTACVWSWAQEMTSAKKISWAALT